MSIVGNPVGRNPLCPPFKNRPVSKNNQLWIESTRATIGNYAHFIFVMSTDNAYLEHRRYMYSLYFQYVMRAMIIMPI